MISSRPPPDSCKYHEYTLFYKSYPCLYRVLTTARPSVPDSLFLYKDLHRNKRKTFYRIFNKTMIQLDVIYFLLTYRNYSCNFYILTLFRNVFFNFVTIYEFKSTFKVILLKNKIW